MLRASQRARLGFKAGIRSALIIGGPVFVLMIVGPAVDLVFRRHWAFEWKFALIFSGAFGIAYGTFVFLNTFFKLKNLESLEDAFEEDQDTAADSDKVSGFVAMEYYWLILNRSFLVFIASDGLYGWKFEGAVDASNTSYFEPYAAMLHDPEFRKSPAALSKLARQRGSFYIPRNLVLSAEYDPAHKWGMGPIPHSGKLRLRLANGRTREFILMGSVDGDSIRQEVLSGVAAGV
jgi:hypothetical protein